MKATVQHLSRYLSVFHHQENMLSDRPLFYTIRQGEVQPLSCDGIRKWMKHVDARDKAAGRAMYAADLCDRRALTAKILHAEQAHALVKRIDAEKARAMDGVEAVFTCFDVPKNYFPTAGHPWSTEPEHQDVADRLLLTDHVRF